MLRKSDVLQNLLLHESINRTNYNICHFSSVELGAMMRVTELKPRSEQASVSWTGNTVSYYLHVIDRTRVSITDFTKYSSGFVRTEF